MESRGQVNTAPSLDGPSKKCSWLSACFKALGCCDGTPSESFGRIPSYAATPEPEAYFVFQAAGDSTQHPLKGHGCNNCDVMLSKTNIVGVADGVNSVAEEGIDPSKLPRELLCRCFALANMLRTKLEEFATTTEKRFYEAGLRFDPNALAKNVLCRAVSELQQAGSTTVCIAVIHGKFLHVANVGDSGLLVYRAITQQPDNSLLREQHGSREAGQATRNGYQLIARTSPGTHSFNSPHQVCRMPEPEFPSRHGLMRETAALTAADALSIQDGDIVILATDGVLDNVHPHEIADILNQLCLPSVPTQSKGVSRVPLIRPERVAKYLVEYAIARAYPHVEGTSPPTPFAENWAKYSHRQMRGGKCDDTTAVVAYVEAVAELDGAQTSLPHLVPPKQLHTTPTPIYMGPSSRHESSATSRGPPQTPQGCPDTSGPTQPCLSQIPTLRERVSMPTTTALPSRHVNSDIVKLRQRTSIPSCGPKKIRQRHAATHVTELTVPNSKQGSTAASTTYSPMSTQNITEDQKKPPSSEDDRGGVGGYGEATSCLMFHPAHAASLLPETFRPLARRETAVFKRRDKKCSRDSLHIWGSCGLAARPLSPPPAALHEPSLLTQLLGYVSDFFL